MEEKDVEVNEKTNKKAFWKDKKNIIIAILIFIILCIGSSSDTETMAKLNGDIANLSNEVTSLSLEKESLSNQLKEAKENEEQNLQAKVENTVNEYKIQVEELQKESLEKDESIKNLTVENENLEKQVNTLTAEKKSLEQKVSSVSATKSQSASSGQTTSVHQSSSSTPSTQTDSYTVYITDTGKKYHSSGCSYLKQSKNAIDKNSAISQGYTACSRCNP